MRPESTTGPIFLETAAGRDGSLKFGEFGFGFFERFDGGGLALSHLTGEAGGNGDGLAEAFDFRFQLGAVVGAVLEDGELLAGLGKLVFEGETAVFLRFVAVVGAGVEVLDGVLGLLQIGLEGGNPAGFGFERLAGGFEFGDGGFRGSPWGRTRIGGIRVRP